jgi:nucleotide-binding universal stress UspA family protein
MFLVAYDGSPAAIRALQHAANLAGPGGEVAVINVIAIQSVSAKLQTVSDAERVRQTRILRDASTLLRRRGLTMETIKAAGDPAAEILAAAEATAADLIVVGQGRKRRVPHQSVSGRIVRTAACDVLVVH